MSGALVSSHCHGPRKRMSAKTRSIIPKFTMAGLEPATQPAFSEETLRLRDGEDRDFEEEDRGDRKFRMTTNLSALRIAVMLRSVYGNHFGSSIPGRSRATLAGKPRPFRTMQGVIVAAALVMALPAIMVFLSLLIEPWLKRWSNVALGILYALIMLTMMLPGGWMVYLVLGAVEIALTVLILSPASNWSRPMPHGSLIGSGT
jgi:uncharacterized protein DUF6326